MGPFVELLDSRENVAKISELTGFPAEFCELAVTEWREAKQKIGREPMIDSLPGGGYRIRSMNKLRHLQTVLKKLAALDSNGGSS